MKRLKWIALFLFLLLVMNEGNAQIDFGAYYTNLITGQSWEGYSRTGDHPDIVLQLSKPEGQLVFWRGNSYLPYWKTVKGQWNLSEIVSRKGDGSIAMPDRVNLFSHVEIVENTTSKVIIHWRYLSDFGTGNPRAGVDPNNFVDETFTITTDGVINRTIKQGTKKIDEWNDPLNQITQVLKLSTDGIVETSRKKPGLSETALPVIGNPEKGPVVVKPSVWFKFDESTGEVTKESISGTTIEVSGHKTLWKKGISGTALEFDGYNTLVTLPAAKTPDLAAGGIGSGGEKVGSGNLTLEGWFVLGAYPWNWVPVVQQGDDNGYFLGVDSHGYPGFMAKINGWWHQLSVPNKPPFNDANHLALFRWYHIAGTYSRDDGMMRLYIDGKEIAGKYTGNGGVQTVKTDILVGKGAVLREPTEGTNTNLQSDYGFDGLIDEVKIYNIALSGSQLAESYKNFNPGTTVLNAPDIQKRSFPNPDIGSQFRAVYTHLPYYETWENLWRFGQYPDVVVGFDKLPIKYVFWRGVSYIPMIVNELNQWYTNEFSETGFTQNAPGDCEPMSDKGCWDSHVRVIENTPARIVVHWRYSLGNASHQWGNYDPATGWGDIADWYYYIYPDGVASKLMRCYSSYPDTWHEWDEQMAVLGEGQHPESVIEKTPVMTLVDSAGNAIDYNWNPDPPKPDYKGKKIQKIYFTGQYDPFTIQNFTGGDVYKGERTWYSVTPSWNHWPTAQVNSSGRNSSFPDRAAHSSISHLFWPNRFQQRGNVSFDEKILLEGMTNQSAASITNLANSWLKAPVVINVTGSISKGYNQIQRAYEFTSSGSKLSFSINASSSNPISNLCFVIKNWGNRTSKALLRINKISQSEGPDFRQGIMIDTDGTNCMIIWVGLTATTLQSFEITKK
jgi:hypothetical protein